MGSAKRERQRQAKEAHRDREAAQHAAWVAKRRKVQDIARDGYDQHGRGAVTIAPDVTPAGAVCGPGGAAFAPAATIRREYAGLRPDQHLLFYIGPQAEIEAAAALVGPKAARDARGAAVVVTDEKSTGVPQSALLLRWLEQYDPAAEYVAIEANPGCSIVIRAPYLGQQGEE